MLGWNLKFFFEVWGHQLRWHKPISMNYWPFFLWSNSLFLSLPLSVSLPLSPLCPTVSLSFLSHSLPSLSTLSLPSLSHCLSPLSVPLSPSPLCLTVSLPYLPIFLALSHISLSYDPSALSVWRGIFLMFLSLNLFKGVCHEIFDPPGPPYKQAYVF